MLQPISNRHVMLDTDLYFPYWVNVFWGFAVVFVNLLCFVFCLCVGICCVLLVFVNLLHFVICLCL